MAHLKPATGYVAAREAVNRSAVALQEVMKVFIAPYYQVLQERYNQETGGASTSWTSAFCLMNTNGFVLRIAVYKT